MGNDALEMVAFEITGGQVHDSKMTIPLLEASNIAFVYFNADKAYGGKKIRENVKNLNAEMTCPNKSNAKTIYEFNKERYKERNVVERYFQKLKCCRRIATRYDKLACVYRAFIYLASILIKIKNKTRETEFGECLLWMDKYPHRRVFQHNLNGCTSHSSKCTSKSHYLNQRVW